jgi:hypothetical protein
MIAGIKQRNAAHRHDVRMFFSGLYHTIACQHSVYTALEKNQKDNSLLKNDPLTGQLVDYRHKEERQWQKER